MTCEKLKVEVVRGGRSTWSAAALESILSKEFLMLSGCTVAVTTVWQKTSSPAFMSLTARSSMENDLTSNLVWELDEAQLKTAILSGTCRQHIRVIPEGKKTYLWFTREMLSTMPLYILPARPITGIFETVCLEDTTNGVLHRGDYSSIAEIYPASLY